MLSKPLIIQFPIYYEAYCMFCELKVDSATIQNQIWRGISKIVNWFYLLCCFGFHGQLAKTLYCPKLFVDSGIVCGFQKFKWGTQKGLHRLHKNSKSLKFNHKTVRNHKVLSQKVIRSRISLRTAHFWKRLRSYKDNYQKRWSKIQWFFKYNSSGTVDSHFGFAPDQTSEL